MAEALLDLRRLNTENLEHPGLQVRIVDTDAAPAQLSPVQHDVIRLGAYPQRLALQEPDILEMRGRERMVHRLDFALVVLLEQGEVRYPGERELVLRDDARGLARDQAQAAQRDVHHGSRIGAEQNQVARGDAESLRQALLLRVREELDDRRLPFALGRNADVREPAEAGILRHDGPVVHHAQRRVPQPLGVDRLDHPALPQHLREHVELRILEHLRHIRDFHAEPKVRLVAAVLVHRVVVLHPRKRKLEFAVAGGLHQDREHCVDDPVHILGGDEGHLHVDLRELRLAVRPQVLVAEAPRDLVVAVHAREHQELLVLLGRLRQGVETARHDPARHEIIARAFRRALRHHRRLDIGEAGLVEIHADRLHDFMALAQADLHALAAQIEIPVRHAEVFGDLRGGLIVQRERRRFALVQNPDEVGTDFNVARRELRVGHVRRAGLDHAFDLDDVLAVRALREVPRLLRIARVENHLRHAVAVAQVDENHAAVVAYGLHPAAEADLRPDVFLPQLSASLCPHHVFATSPRLAPTSFSIRAGSSSSSWPPSTMFFRTNTPASISRSPRMIAYAACDRLASRI